MPCTRTWAEGWLIAAEGNVLLSHSLSSWSFDLACADPVKILKSPLCSLRIAMICGVSSAFTMSRFVFCSMSALSCSLVTLMSRVCDPAGVFGVGSVHVTELVLLV